MNPRKILVIKICCLGDVIFLTPMLRSLHQAYPKAAITLLGSSWVKPVAERIPYLSNVICFDEAYAQNLLGKIKGFWRIFFVLRRGRFDVAIVTHRNRFFLLLARLVGIRTRIGYDDKIVATHSVAYKTRMHEVDRYLELVAPLGIRTPETDTELQPSSEDVLSTQNILAQHGVDDSKSLVGIFPGGGENPGTSMKIKRWPKEYFVQLIDRLLAEYPCCIVLVGSDQDRSVNTSIAEEVREKTRIIDLSGELTLQQLIGFASFVNVFVGSDSGPTHMAAAVGTPTIALFGPSDPRLVAPRGSKHYYIWQQVECSPCYTPASVQDKKNFVGNEFICRTGTHACMRTVSVDSVYNQMKPFLNSTR